MKEKICINCGANMIYNRFLGRWECDLCGNCEESNANFGLNRLNSIL